MSVDRNLQRMIHVGCKQVGLDADARHDLQLMVTGKASMADMTEDELQRVVAALKQRGFKAGFKGRHASAPRADLRFVHVLWKLLGDAGALHRPGRDGLNAFVRARFEGKWKSVPIDIDALREAGQINDVIRALKDWCQREGVDSKP